MDMIIVPTLLLGGFSLYAASRLYSPRSAQNQMLRDMFEGSQTAHALLDDKNNLVMSSASFRALGKDVISNGYASLVTIFHNDGSLKARIDDCLNESRQGKSCALECTRADVNELRYKISFHPVPALSGFVHICIDNADSGPVTMSLSEDHAKLLDTIDNAPVGFFSVDERGIFTFVNATFARWINEKQEDILGNRTLHEFLVTSPADGAPYDIKEGGGVRQLTETMMRASNGREFLAAITQTVVHEGDGQVCTRAVVTDLTSQQAMMQALADSETRFKRFFEESPLGVAIIDMDGLVKDCNEALAKMIGRPIAEIEGQVYTEMIDMTDWPTISAVLDRIGKGAPSNDPVEIRLWKDDKKNPLPCHLFARLLSNGGNMALHFIDLSQQKSLENQFIQSQKMQAVGQLAGGIAHDFNNLLTAIIGFCDLLLLRHKPGDPSFGDIQQIKQNSNRAANLVRQLLAFSRQQTLRPQVQDITDILTEVSHLLRRLIGSNIELKLVHGHDLGLVKVDGGQMEQVFVNMAVNARDAMADGGTLTILTSHFHNDETMNFGEDVMPTGDWVRIDVRDTGTGIPPDIMARIFEPFFTTKDIGKGTGLGLATVHGIIRQTGGYLGVTSSVGVGTTFSVYLPRVKDDEKPQQKMAQSEEAERDLTGSARILLVEDEDAVRTFSTRALTNKGYEVLTAENGEAGLSVFNEQTKEIDLLITDVMMPGMDGPTLAQEIRARMPQLKIIFISGYTEERLKDTLGEGVYFLPKPFTLKQLAAKVKEVLEQ